jgi:DNA-binding Xre family transcriptional regulator
MPFEWNLRKWLAVERDIYKPSQLQALIVERTGVQLSIQAISALMNSKPNALRIQTLQVLCDALECDLCDFCNMTYTRANSQQKKRQAVGETPRRLYGGKASQPSPPIQDFPDPRQYVHKGDLQPEKE